MQTLPSWGRPRYVAVASLGFLACGPSRGVHQKPGASSVRAAPSGATASYGLKLIQGPGFTLAVPLEAVVEQHRDSSGYPRWQSRAPTQSITATLGTADTTRYTDDRPLYALTVTTGRKPAEQPLKAWGDSVVAADEAKADELTRGESGSIQTVAGDSAYLRLPTCGDCGIYIFTFARGDRIVELQYSLDTTEPLGVRKHGLYALILSTFRWTSPGES